MWCKPGRQDSIEEFKGNHDFIRFKIHGPWLDEYDGAPPPLSLREVLLDARWSPPAAICEEQRFCVFVPLAHADDYWEWVKKELAHLPRRRRWRLYRVQEPVWVQVPVWVRTAQWID